MTPVASKPTPKACYLAGPMRHRGKAVTEAKFAAAAATLRGRGWTVYVPKVDEADGFAGRRDTVERDIGMVLKLKAENGDAIVLLSGWQLSRGVRAELAVAQWLGLRALLLEEALEEQAGDKEVPE